MRVEPEQSSSDLHALGHVVWQIPSQQSWPVDAQSVDDWQAFGQGSNAGLRQRPGALKDESMLFTDVQQTSPWLVWQSELVLHVFGHWFAPVQTP
jgi:hypothetical protein